jgi:hypothetical protein
MDLVDVAKVIPLFVKRVFFWNSAGAGIIFLALIIPSFLSPLVGIYPIALHVYLLCWAEYLILRLLV